ncbi:1-aminocyclopropane-1-carboxylate deaminase/D-cysteine desulfhydrase [Sphingobacterium spiritivorum]|uniref:1-aminocyclopropane-1-carboxylate deaminase/D-cysteine desulfhydrase n=1 Tax=Sphingobacterium spiritivorum TaxID=258 RepID=UPI003DA2DE15
MELTFDFHSPEEEIVSPLYIEKKVRIYVKRDDLIHPYISGNKWRKLQYPLQKALQQNKQTLVTFGGAWSNHLLATACAGAKFGFRTHGMVRGEDVSNPVLALCRLYGMKLHFVSRDQYQNKTALFLQYFGEQPDNAFFIDEGGYSREAAEGCAHIIEELHQDYDHICCASGTGTTVAGLQLGLEKANLSTTLNTVPVLKGGAFIRNEVENLAVDPSGIILHTDYHFGGYAKTKPELLDFIRAFVSRTGIMIEPTYTGKLFFAIDDLIRKDYFKPGSRILLIHTGGLTGFLGMYDRF